MLSGFGLQDITDGFVNSFLHVFACVLMMYYIHSVFDTFSLPPGPCARDITKQPPAKKRQEGARFGAKSVRPIRLERVLVNSRARQVIDMIHTLEDKVLRYK